MRFIKYHLPVFLWALLIFYLSSVQSLSSGLGFYDLILRKLAHVFEFLVLFLLLARSLQQTKVINIIPISMGITLLYAISDELHQSFVPTRVGNIMDVLIDGGGIILGVIILKYVFASTTSKNVKQTYSMAKNFGNKLKGGDLVCLNGDLGSGKTTFVKGLAKSLGVNENLVISPTFTICKTYKVNSEAINALHHLDFYRLASPEDVREIGFEELLQDKRAVVVVEWADKFKNMLPPNRYDINFSYGAENKRKIEINKHGK